jgi:hypothetical protein
MLMRICQLSTFLVALTTLALVAGGPMEPQESVREKVEAMVKEEWKKIEATIEPAASPQDFMGWRYALSPAIPAAWPPDGKGSVYYYAFAYGLNPTRLADAEFVAAPWLRVKVDAIGKSAPQLEILTKKIKEIGIQGVRPLEAEELGVLKQAKQVEEQVYKLTQATSLRSVDSVTVKQHYQLWCSTQGAIAEQLRPQHKKFFDWVGCK